METRLRRLYEEGKLTKDEIVKAVIKGWITPEIYEAITGEPVES